MGPPVFSAAGTGGVIGKWGVIEGQEGPHLPELDVPQPGTFPGCSSQAMIIAQSFRVDFHCLMPATEWDRKQP